MRYITKHGLQKILPLLILACIIGGCAEKVEEVKYNVLHKSKNLELREYPEQIVAETLVDGSIEDAGNKAFRRLFGYISGNNLSQEKIAMTAPVSQEPKSEKIAMTAPVAQMRAQDGWIVSFAMPSSYTLETLPTPLNPQVTLRQIPAQRMAAVRYSGTWSEKNYLRFKMQLEKWIEANGYRTLGEPVWARYNAPFTPWFLRRNEILIPVDDSKKVQ